MNSFSGVLFLHAIPKASAEELDVILKRLRVKDKGHEWNLQPLIVGCVKTVIDWQAATDVAPQLVTELAKLGNIRFEVTLHQTSQQVGRRWSFVPGLGVFSAAVDEAGNLLIAENQLQNALYGSGNNLLQTQSALRKLLGTAWDDELERFRVQSYEPVVIGWMAGLG